MKFEHTLDGETLHISFNGDILYAETTDLSAYLDDLRKEKFGEAVLNFKNVSGITSSAIGSVIDFHEKLRASGRKMRISGMSDKAYTVFKYFKLDQLFPIEK